MRSKNSEVARVLEKIEQRLRRRLGPNDDQYKRFKRKSEAIVKELSTRPLTASVSNRHSLDS